MRLLHTSDWHLGRSFHREGMLTHQAAYVDHLVEVVRAEQVDVVLVAGDVYDRALPPVDAVRLADEALVRLAAEGVTVVVSSGNHDSAQRLGFSARLIEAAGVHLRTTLARVGEPVLLEDRHGPVAVHPLPYLDPYAVAGAWSLDERSHAAALGAAMSRVRADLSGRPGVRSVVTAHAFVAGAQPSDSERDISVGGVERVPKPVFDGITYAALGHLHGPHVLEDHLRYSGSPLAYSFSETDQVKGSWLVDLDADGLASATFVPAPAPRPLARLRGDLDDLLRDPDLAPHEGSWLEVALTDVRRPEQAMERLRERFPHTLLLSFDAVRPALGAPPASRTHARTDHDVAWEFMADLGPDEPTDAERRLLWRAVDACCDDATADPDPAEEGD